MRPFVRPALDCALVMLVQPPENDNSEHASGNETDRHAVAVATQLASCGEQGEVLSAKGALDAELRSCVRERVADTENPLLLCLKELESLERLVEKVGRIDLHAGEAQGLAALLSKFVRLKETA